MASKYWIKLYHEILNDPKMGSLSDNLWRRAIELFLLAGELDQGGELLDIAGIAWSLRLSCNETLQKELQALQERNILTLQDNGIWLVTHFSERQKAVEVGERVRKFRDRERKKAESEQPGKVSEESNQKPKAVTNRYIDTDTDTDTDISSKDDSGKPQQPELFPSGNSEEDSPNGPTEELPGENLLPDTPEVMLLFEKINSNRQARGRNNAKQFKSIEQKNKCLEAVTRLGSYANFEASLTKGLEYGLTDLTSLVNWIAKYKPGQKNGVHRNGSRPTRTRQPGIITAAQGSAGDEKELDSGSSGSNQGAKPRRAGILSGD